MPFLERSRAGKGDSTPIRFGVLHMTTLLIGFGLGIFAAALLLVIAFDVRKAPARQQHH
nr:MAG TPA: Cell cycle exit and neuronal differentiation protein 1 [Caudoviricetes sp.]